MKTLLITFLFLTFRSVTFSQSILNYQAGTTIDVQTGASVCADSVIMNGTFTGGGTICGLLYTLNLTAIIEAFYDPSIDLMVSDTAVVYLRNSLSPYAVVDSNKALLNSSGTGTFSFANAVNGAGYYIVVTHRNSIETWSSTAPVFSGGTLTYDFTSAAAQAYGNNMKLVDISPVTYGIYSGDVNKDGTVDLSDLSLIDNDAYNFVSGYVTADLTGDNFVDLADLSIADNNAFNFVSLVRP
jgi:hypothetical protein